jgi:hypothetical protein
LNAKAGVFSAGTEAGVLAYPMDRLDGPAHTLKASPLICHEDTLPFLAREFDLNHRSPFTNWVGDRPWWALLTWSIGMVVVSRLLG